MVTRGNLQVLTALVALSSVFQAARGCGELWVHSAESQISGVWSLFHDESNERPTYRRTSLSSTAGRRSAALYLYHQRQGHVGRWLIAPLVGQPPGGGAVAWVESWALTPLGVSAANASAQWTIPVADAAEAAAARERRRPARLTGHA